MAVSYVNNVKNDVNALIDLLKPKHIRNAGDGRRGDGAACRKAAVEDRVRLRANFPHNRVVEVACMLELVASSTT